MLQRDVIAAQDAQLDDLSRTLTSVRHIACAVNEELDLQSRLLVRACPRRRLLVGTSTRLGLSALRAFLRRGSDTPC